MLCERILWPAMLGLMLHLHLAGSAVCAEPDNFPKEARDRFNRGQDLQKNRQYKEAIGAFEEAIKLGMKSFPRVHLYRANSFFDLKDYDTAIAQYTQFLAEFSLEDSCRY